ncbi:MAG: sugar transferase, partial [Gammaproteobacteria bacterium]
MKLFGQHIHAPILLLAAAEYGVAAIAFAVAVSLLVGGGLQLADAEGRVIPWVFAFSTAVVVGLTAVGLYQPKQRLRPEGVALRLIAALVFAVVCLSLVSLYYPIGRDGPVLLVSSTLSLGLLGVSRIVFAKFIDHEAFRRRVLVYGAGDRAASLLKLRRRSDQRAFKIVAFVPAPGDRSRLQDERVVSTPLNLVRYAHDHDIDEIVVAMDERRETLPIRELLECRFSGIDVIDLLGFFERETGKIKVDLMNPAWLIFSEGFSIKPSQRVASRILDLVIAALLAVLSLPVVVLVAAAIFLEDGAPVLYRQKRVGYGGKTFG